MTQPSDLRPGDRGTGADLDLDLAAGLGATARLYDVPPGDLDAVLGRGRQRAHRRRRALAGLCALSLVAGTVASVELLDGEQETTVASTSGLVRGAVGIEWRAVRPDAALGFATGMGTSAPLYALSTAAGEREIKPGTPRVVWRSDDGVEWTAVSTLGPDLFLSDLAPAGDRIYAVGTAPAEAAAAGRRPVSPLVVGWSDDGARTWEQARLPIDLAAISARSLRSHAAGTGVVTTPLGTLVVGVLDATLDVAASLPAGVTAPNGWAFTATGVDLLGPDREFQCPGARAEAEVEGARAVDGAEVPPLVCGPAGQDEPPVLIPPQQARGVTASYTWEQLGVDGDLLRAVRRQPVAFFAPAGSQAFERVDLPAVDPVQGAVLLDSSEAGITVALTTAERDMRHWPLSPEVTLLRSADGRFWAAEALPGGTEMWAQAAGHVAGTPVIVGQRSSGAVVLRGDGKGGWTPVPLADAVDAGARAGRVVNLASAGVGPFGIVAAVVVAPHEGEGPVEYRLLASRDGRTWSDTPVSSLVDEPVRTVVRAGVVGDRATVAISVGGPGEKSQQVVLVGTPT